MSDSATHLGGLRMSGDVFQPMEVQDDADHSRSRNPLLCYLCNEPYEEPCILGCFHSFCTRCLRGRSSDGTLTCPLCSSTHTLKDGASLPPSDLLLKFMVEASTEEKAQCANCDSTSMQMFFCNTCMQPLCSQCREDTHRAKMFSRHDMVLLTKRAREVHKKCKVHEEPYIMFSSEKKIMLCINCFRDMRIESRGHCLDLETAYKQNCKRLDLKVQAFRELQNSVREGILLFRGLMEEIKSNAEKERQAIEDLHASLIQKLNETKLILMQKVDSQYTDKESTFLSQLNSLSALVPTLHTHLVVASAFFGSANKFEFLDLAYVLMDRLKSIVQKQHPLHATLSGQIDTNFKTEYNKSVEPLLYVPAQRPTLNTNGFQSPSTVTPGASCQGSPITASRLTPTNARRSSGLNGAKVKFIDAKGQFAEHCREFETAHRDLLARFEQMKNKCQELQRDLTMRRCLAKREEVHTLGEKIESVQATLDTHYSTLEAKLPLLEKHWEESVDRIVNEQDLYQAQLADVMRLKHESQHLRVITAQLSSFVASIAAVTKRLAPKLGQTTQANEQENQMSSLLEEINAVQPDSQVRVDAIRDAEEERQTQNAARTNPLDDELIKTKGLLRCPSLRTLKGERRPVSSEIVKNSDDSETMPPVSDVTKTSSTHIIVSSESCGSDFKNMPGVDSDCDILNNSKESLSTIINVPHETSKNITTIPESCIKDSDKEAEMKASSSTTDKLCAKPVATANTCDNTMSPNNQNLSISFCHSMCCSNLTKTMDNTTPALSQDCKCFSTQADDMVTSSSRCGSVSVINSGVGVHNHIKENCISIKTSPRSISMCGGNMRYKIMSRSSEISQYGDRIFIGDKLGEQDLCANYSPNKDLDLDSSHGSNSTDEIYQDSTDQSDIDSYVSLAVCNTFHHVTAIDKVVGSDIHAENILKEGHPYEHFQKKKQAVRRLKRDDNSAKSVHDKLNSGDARKELMKDVENFSKSQHLSPVKGNNKTV